MSGWLRYGAVLFAAGLFLSGLALGYRLAAEHAQGRMARMRQAQLAEQARLQKAANSQVMAVEHQQAEQLARLSQHYQQERQDAQAQTARLLAELQSAHGRLRIPIQPAPCASDRVSPAAPAARFGDGETRAELVS